MKHLRASLLCGLICTSIYSSASFAAAFQLYELGTPIIGTAGVGQAVTTDASSAYFNPASMTLSSHSQFMLGSQMLIPYINFSRNTSTTILGDNGSNAGNLTPGMGIYYSYSYSPKLKFGVSVTTPFGGSMSFDNGWVGRFSLQNVLFYTINLNPSVAYRFADWGAFGAGVSVEYMNMQEEIALPLTRLVDGQAKISLASVSPGFNLGLLLTPSKTTQIGIAYRSQIVHHLSGNTTFLRIPITPSTSTKMVMPAELIVSASQAVSENFKLLGEAGWANWSSMRAAVLTVAGYTATVPQNWSSTYRLGLGGQYQALSSLILQLGASYDSSPTTTSKRLPDLPMDRQVRIGAGVIYRLLNPVSLAASYEYINYGRAPINNVSSLGVVSGSYSRNYANAIQISLNVDV
jgi:long-chain fatty acid transport protein